MAKRKPREQQSKQRDGNAKMQDLDAFRENPEGQQLTTDQGLRINDDQNSLKTGERGDRQTLAHLMSRGYVEEYRSLLLFNEMIQPVEEFGPITQRLIKAVASDERRLWRSRSAIWSASYDSCPLGPVMGDTISFR